MLVCRIVRPYYNLFKREKSISSKSDFRERSLYKYFVDFQTRWRDNDIYGHVNNVVYGEWIDSIVNKYLIEKCSLEPLASPLIGFVVSSHCEYYSPVSYPSKISAGLFVKRIGKSSVDYSVGIFENSQAEKASAVGGFTHVFVDRINRRPQTLNDEMKKQLLSISNIIDSKLDDLL
ncbi:unnamed protein product [Rotaria sp. Silwood2]|nr:unnamed protein product [Rotaria sp. Silwood2]CAF3197149.1 unnamed protein product [Rotaria sp. Silwood2]CAF4134919.1 unnamed protein product [Rotaria sp. Silwood2]CAF4357492.1 unnamed protein product [Rotaria sp. Silwood2]